MKKINVFLTMMFVLACANFAFGQSNVSLPSGVQSILNQNFPNWKVVKNSCQTVASGDFNGDRKTDYIAIITYQNGGSVVGYVSQGNSYRQIVVESLTRQDAETSAVNPARKGEEALVGGMIGDDPKFAPLKSDGFYYGTCESDDGTTYVLKGNDFVSVYEGGDDNSGGNNNNNGSGVGVGGSNPRGECTGKTYTNVSSKRICFPNGDISFADELINFSPGSPAEDPNKESADPNQSLGIPNTVSNSAGQMKAATLGCSGQIIVKFNNNALIDVDGPDLYVFEVGTIAEPTIIEISKDGKKWINIGRVEGGTREIDIAGKVNRGDEFYFVRLTDANVSGVTSCERNPGADIDAVGAIGTVQRNRNQIPNTPSEIRGGGSTNNGGNSVDLGQAVIDAIRNRGGKKPDNNSGGNNNNRDGNEFIVKGPNPWLDTGIDVTDGCVIELSSSGKVDVSAGYGIHDANGTSEFYSADSYPVMSKKRYGLAAQITSSRTNSRDKNRDAWAYSDGKVHTSRQNGRLWLVVNDDNPGDNSGEFRVRVKTNCGGGNSGGNNSSENNNSVGGITYKDSRGVSTKYGLGDLSFADRVVSFKKGNPAPASANANPDDSLGKPNYNESRDEENYVTLGCAGVLTVEFVDNVLVDGNGNDLYVYEIGPNVEPTKVEISKDGKNWINVGNVAGSTSSLDISSYVNPNDEFRFVRLTDLKSACGSYPGADIDAIGAISSRRNDGGSTSNNPPSVNNNPPPRQDDVPFDPNNQIKVKVTLYNPQKTSGDDCLQGAEDVTMSITKRPGMLRAAIEELIRYPADKNGYLNYVTKVSLEDIKIENGTALIYLSGSISTFCVKNRIIRQLEGTAKQFPTVKDVRIFVNGTLSESGADSELLVLNGYASNLVKPAYPSAARNAGATGAVNVKVKIDGSGNVIFAQAFSGHSMLRSSAEAAARASKFGSSGFNRTGMLVFNFVP